MDKGAAGIAGTITGPEQARTSKKSEVWGWVRFIIYLGIAYFLITHIIGLSRVSGHSMQPSLNNSDILLINRLSVYTGSPHYGDVVVVKSHKLSYELIKRVIGVEGDRVAIQDGVVYKNGQPLPELYTAGVPDDMPEVLVGENEVFVMGDNRTPGESLDSRSSELGLIEKKEIKGYALMKLIPWSAIAKPLKHMSE
ncbi:signal peptidase I [Paenibacillus physcomitrellae]|uniref:Signal peptidase I n=1 Tax=Paenibacillus physcomitrellae TaxID=1619311 RepID=A0ABQ1FXC5_9BACL|nr:signal peptidase I [Paenibacillus physcomitrellae]GGA33225.1 signal peptidase I [Paenibacillus physcomitrellae]